MTPEEKFHSYLIAATLGILYYIIKTLPTPSGSSAKVIGALVAFFGAKSTYKYLADGLNAILRRWTAVKKLILGASFLDGTWVGYFVGHAGDLRYVVETFEQDISSLNIRGTSYDTGKNIHALWRTLATTVDAPGGYLLYEYTCDIRTRSVTHTGIGSFQLHRTAQHKPAYELRGYVADVNDGTRLEVVERKISDKNLDHDDALERAIKLFGGKAVGAQAAPTLTTQS